MMIEFIVLACSHKHHGRCVAGIDLTNKRLIRLVSHDEETNYAIPKTECKINSRNLLPLDVISVDLTSHMEKHGAQTENYYFSFPLVKSFIRKATIDELKPYLYECKISLYPFPFCSKNAFMRKYEYEKKEESLCLVRAYALHFKTIEKNGIFKTKVSFDIYQKYSNKEKTTLVDYSVTDPEYMMYDGQPNNANKSDLGRAFLLISLGQDDDSDYYYKYVSGIIDFTNAD